METVFDYLEAVGATLSDLDRELDRVGASDPLDDFVAETRERIRCEPDYRERAAKLLARFGTGDPVFRELAQLILDSEERYRKEMAELREEQSGRAEAPESDLPADADGPPPKGTED